MKKVLSTIVAILIAAPTFAQYSSGGFSLDEENLYYGVRLGMSISSISGDIPEIKPLGSKVGLTMGGVIGLRCSNTAPVFLESGVYYTERGVKKSKISVSYNTLEIPIIVKYGIKATDDIALLPFLGPTFSYALSGKYKWDNADTGTFEEKDWTALNRANMGIKFGCGAEYSNLYLELAYQFGITNLSKDGINSTLPTPVREKHSGHSNALLINFGVNF
ncbi:MAG: PorT family protein [Prevotella sp.]|nr:PorT family protein [Prevotella sp.]MBQ6209078.1 PorT family protein [Prevotella sp.]